MTCVFHVKSHVTCHVIKREKEKKGYKKSLEPFSYFGHNRSILTHNELKFQVKVRSDRTHEIEGESQVLKMMIRPQNEQITYFERTR